MTAFPGGPDHVLMDVRGPALWLELNRPAALNALTPRMLEGLEAGLERAAQEPEITAVVIGGRGRAFCVGADLKESVRIDDGIPSMDFLRSFGRLLANVENLSKPVIAAVNGMALAGGLELVLACDLGIVAEGAQLGDAHANFGLIPGGGATARLPRRVGIARSNWLLYSGETISASRAEEIGLVNEVIGADHLASRVNELVESLSRKSPLALSRIKHLATRSTDRSLESALEAELLQSELHYRSADMREGLDAFRAGRKPKFSGS